MFGGVTGLPAPDPEAKLASSVFIVVSECGADGVSMMEVCSDRQRMTDGGLPLFGGF